MCVSCAESYVRRCRLIARTKYGIDRELPFPDLYGYYMQDELEDVAVEGVIKRLGSELFDHVREICTK